MSSQPCPPPTPPPCIGGTLHTVAAGETLSSIAQSFGVTLDQLVSANPQLITVGQVLCVPIAPSMCCLVLTPTASAPPTAGGTGWVHQSPPAGVTALVAAIGLPAPGTLGPYTVYVARFVPPSGVSFQFTLSAVVSPGGALVYAGGVSNTAGPLASGTQVLVFAGTPSGGVGPVVLQGSLANCH